MSYLAPFGSTTDYGVVEIGNNINVSNGIISLSQDVSPNANVTFFNANVSNLLTANTGNIVVLNANNANVSGNLVGNNGSFSGNLSANGALVVTSVTPSNGAGISLSNVVSNGYAASFTVTNTGVLQLTAGSGISLTANTGNITISSFGADLINVVGISANYTADVMDEYIGVSSANAVTVTLPSGFDGRVYTIKDEYGQGSGKITIAPTGAQKIDNKTNYIISTPYQSVSLVSRAGNWWII
jgi:hypothetical protein